MFSIITEVFDLTKACYRIVNLVKSLFGIDSVR